jgi:type IV pilus assembly protein PilB
MIAITPEIRRKAADRSRSFASQLEGLASRSTDAVDFLQQAVQYGYIDRDSAGEVIGEAIGRTHVNIGKTLFQQDLIDKVPLELAIANKVIPLYKLGTVVTVAMVDPLDTKVVKALELFLGAKVSAVFSFPDEVESAVLVKYHSSDQLDKLITDFDFSPFLNGDLTDARLAELVQANELVGMTDSLILMALKERASDIHIEPKKNDLVLRFRVDGQLAERMVLPKNLSLALVSRFKVISGMDITNRRLPQDGRINFPLPIKNIDIRLSSLPTIHGEKLVLRLLGSPFAGTGLNLETLDIAPSILTRLKQVIRQPNGILFVTGPTGSGKTTTLYAALNFINRPNLNVITLEDPVEYDSPTINQVQVDERVGRTFASLLRAVMRQDPDVILVGEIRDTETARTATQAAMTGHLVLTTLHTNDAIQASTRLMDMGVERFMVAPSLIGVLNQKLIRRVCPYCRVEHAPGEKYLARLFRWREGAELPTFFRGEGCERCNHTGYLGRIGIHEFLNITHRVRDALLEQANYAELLQIATSEGFRDMRYDGYKKALRGLTSLQEIVEATMPDTAE